MASYFSSISSIPTPRRDRNRGLEAITEAIRSNRERDDMLDQRDWERDRLMREEARQAKKDDAYLKQVDAQTLNVKRQEQRDKLKFEREEAERRARAINNFRKLYGRGEYGAAETELAAQRFQDPGDPEKLAGIGLEYDKKVTPGAPVGTFFNRGSEGLSLTGGQKLQADESIADPRVEAAQKLRLTLGYDRPQPQDETVRGPDKEELVGARLKFPTGEESYIAADEARNAARGEAERRAQQLADAAAMEPDPRQRALLLREANMARGEADKLTRSAASNLDLQEDSQAFKAQESALDRSSAERRTTIMANRPRSGGKGPPDPNDPEYQWKLGRVHTQLDEAVNKYLGRIGYTKNVVEPQFAVGELQRLSGVATISPGAATLIRGKFARTAQGAGVLTDQDLAVFYRNMGGIADRIGTTVEDILSGTITDEKQKYIKEALDVTEQEAMARQMKVGKGIEDVLRARPNVDDENTGRYLETYAPGYYRVWRERKNAEAAAAGASDAPPAYLAPGAGGRPAPGGGGARIAPDRLEAFKARARALGGR